MATPRSERQSELRRYLWPALLALLIGLAWSNSFKVPFLLDDHESIVTNATLRQLETFAWLQPPATGGETVSGRPLLNLSLAVNYAISGLDVWSYHLLNLLIHLGSAWLVFGLVVRTLFLSSERTPSAPPETPTAWAFAIALIWALHPLQTAAVTYIVQRAEALAGFWTLLCVYAFLRHATTSGGARRWAVISVGACIAGVLTKETAAVAPVLAALYDRTFLAGSFARAWQLRRKLYLGYTVAWALLLLLVITTGGRGESAGLDTAIGPWSYLLTQAEAIVRYLRLAFWPDDLVFDYGAYTAAGVAGVWPQAVVVLALLILTVWGVARYPKAGFLGAWFFVTLAPSSSILPVATQTIAEHRLYLALAAIAVAVAWAARQACRRQPRLALGLLVGVGLMLGGITWTRNRVYSSELSLWRDTVQKWPHNARAQNNLGLASFRAGEHEPAIAAFERALELQPHHAFAHLNLGNVYLAHNRPEAARPHLEAAVRLAPELGDAQLNLGHALTQLGDVTSAVAHYRQLLTRYPDDDDARVNLAALLIDQESWTEARQLLATAIRSSPALVQAHYHLGRLEEAQRNDGAAEAAYARAIAVAPNFAPAHLALGHLRLAQGDLAAAAAAYRTAATVAPDSAEPHFGLGSVHARRQDLNAALAAFSAALERDPQHLRARVNQGNCLLGLGRIAEAIAAYEDVLRRHPGEPTAERNLALARELQRRAGR